MREHQQQTKQWLFLFKTTTATTTTTTSSSRNRRASIRSFWVNASLWRRRSPFQICILFIVVIHNYTFIMDPLLIRSIHNTIPTQRVFSLHHLYIHVLKTLILLPDMVCHHVETLTVLLKLSLAKIHNYYELHFLLYLQEDLRMMLRYNRDLSNEA